MRFKYPASGATRVVRRFLWWPKFFPEFEEWRWLEWVKLKQFYTSGYMLPYIYVSRGWYTKKIIGFEPLRLRVSALKSNA